MDMIISSGKSRKNVDAYVLSPPDAQIAVDLLISLRLDVGNSVNNPYIFARTMSNTPLSGNTDLQEESNSCPGLKFPERITSTALRKYIATVSQVGLIKTVNYKCLYNQSFMFVKFVDVL